MLHDIFIRAVRLPSGKQHIQAAATVLHSSLQPCDGHIKVRQGQEGIWARREGEVWRVKEQPGNGVNYLNELRACLPRVRSANAQRY